MQAFELYYSLGVMMLSILLIFLGAVKVYRYLYVGFHIRVSDTDTPYVNLKFKGYHDELDAFITDSGKCITLKIKQQGEYLSTPTYIIPSKYDTLTTSY